MFQPSRKAETPLQEETFQVRITSSVDHLRNHHDTSVISNISQAGTADIIRLPRLWANNKDMKFETDFRRRTGMLHDEFEVDW